MPRLIVEVIGDTSHLEKSFKRANRATNKFGRNMSQTTRGAVAGSLAFRGLGRSVAFASGGFLGAAGLTLALRGAFDEMLRGEAVAADTAAVLKSTGNIAGVTAKQVDALGTSLQQLTGFDDEAIKSAENLILTFTNVRNVAGDNNDIFNQAVQSTLDLSRRFDQDLSTSAVQLGKALQDPVRGVTALRRAGITLSASQARLIRRLVNTGRLLEAQKILLKEVRVETGQAARAYGQTLAGQLDILQGNLSNLGGELAKVLNPEIKKLTKQFNAWLANPENKMKIIEGFRSGVRGLGDAFEFAADAGGFLKRGFDAIRKDAYRTGAAIADLADKVGLLDKASVEAAKQRIADGKKLRAGAAAAARGVDPALVSSPFVTGAGRGGTKKKIAAAAGADRPGEVITTKDVAEAERKRQLRNRWFDEMIGRKLDRVQDVKTLKGQIAALDTIAALIRDRLAVTKDITRQNRLTDQLLDIKREQDALKEEIKFNQIEAKANALAKERERLARERERIEQKIAAKKAKQFRSLGLTAGGDEIVAGKRLLRLQLGRIEDAVEGTFLDTNKTRSVLAAVKNILKGGLDDVSRDVRAKVKEILDDIKNQLKEHEKPTSTFHKASVRNILRSAGLSPEEVKRVSGRLSRVSSTGQIGARGPGAFGVAGTGTIVIQHTSLLDGKVVSKSTTKHQQKTRRRNPEQKRGPFAGGRIQ